MWFFYLFSYLPFWILYLISDCLYVLVYYVFGYRKDVIMNNLRNAFPNKTEAERILMAKEFYHNLADIFLEIVKALTMPIEDICKHYKITDTALAEKMTKEQGKYVIFTGGHLGNWDWSLLAQGFYCPIDYVYTPVTNKFFEKLTFQTRTRTGAYPVTAKNTYRAVIERKKMGRALGLGADQATNNTEYWTMFLNQETGFLMGMETIARKHNLPVFYLHIRKVRRGFYEANYELIAQPPYDNLPKFAILKKYKELLEADILADPTIWLWSHKRWKYSRPADMPLQA